MAAKAVADAASDLRRAWRLLCHPGSRALRRVDAVIAFVGTQIKGLRPVLVLSVGHGTAREADGVLLVFRQNWL